MAAEIRPARTADIDSLVALEQAAFSSDRISRRAFSHLIGSASARTLVLVAAGQMMGYCVVLFRSASRVARLYSIAVMPDAPAGSGRRLLARAEEMAGAGGASALRLEVRQDNLRARALYERSGYGSDGEVPGYYADGATALRYRKRLARVPDRPAPHPGAVAAAS